jgi:hypothetical protein
MVAFVYCNSPYLLADGGALVLRNQSGPLIISVFSSPTPLTAGPADLSVLVQDASNHMAILDALVMLRLHPAGGGNEINVIATHAQATNKLLYAYRVIFPSDSSGDWRLTVRVETTTASAETEGTLRAAPPTPAVVAYWPYFALVPLMIALFALNQWLKSKRGRNNARVL